MQVSTLSGGDVASVGDVEHGEVAPRGDYRNSLAPGLSSVVSHSIMGRRMR